MSRGKRSAALALLASLRRTTATQSETHFTPCIATARTVFNDYSSSASCAIFACRRVCSGCSTALNRRFWSSSRRALLSPTGLPSPPSTESAPFPPSTRTPSILRPAPSFVQTSFATTASPALPASTEWDIVIVGGGHNGLVAAAYLAGKGLSVCLLERRHILGGAAVTEELHPGFKYSRCSYLFSLFRPQIVADLQLKRHGLKFHFRDPSSFTPMLDGRHLMMGPDMAFTQREIGKFSVRDAAAYPRYEAQLSRLVSFFEPLLDAPPPGAGAGGWREAKAQAELIQKMLGRAWQLGSDVMDFHEVMTAPANKILSRWFESEPLKSTLATDAIIGAMLSPSVPGSGYVLFHHVMGEIEGRQGVWAYVEGGMGAVSDAIARSAVERGATLVTNAAVERITVHNNRVTGVVLASGQEVKAKRVLSNVSPTITYGQLLPAEHLPDEFMSRVRNIDTTSPVTKINISMDRIPSFTCLPTHNNTPGPQHRGTIHFIEHTRQIEAAYQAALGGKPSPYPVIEMTIPSSLDPTLAPPGQHVASLFTQYTPYHIEGGWTDDARHNYAQSVFAVIEQYCPGFTASLLHYEVLTPVDLEAEFGLSGGNIFHTAMGLDQLAWLRPVKGWGRYRAPVEGLYLCGAGTHPGGGVMGAPGRNAAEIVGYDIRRGK